MAPSRFLANVTLALAVLAALLLQVALYDRQSVAWHGWTQLAIAALFAVAVASCRRKASWGYLVSFGGLALLSFVWDQVLRATAGLGDPYEVQMAYALRNLMLGLAASRGEARTQHFAGLASFFLVLFSFLWSMNLATTLLLVAYALLGMWWLLGCYWDGIQGRLADRSEHTIPLRPAITAIVAVLVLVAAALPFARSPKVASALHGFFPSSGGSSWADEFAQEGVGDGDQMVAAKEDASSFGAVESELFLESKRPSLYDVFNEQGEPRKRDQKRGRQRAIALSPSTMEQNHERLGQNQQANREFDTVRSRRKDSPKSKKSYQSPALLQIRGRVPVHLGLYAYDTWDGRSLGWSGADERVYRKLDTESPDGKSWLRLSLFFPEPLFDHTERHQLRVINLDTDRVPSPPNLTALNVDHLQDVDMFRCTHDGVLALDAIAIPQLTVLSVESRRLPRNAKPPLRKSLPPAASGKIAELAQAWTAGVETGWPQVTAICDRLRTEYQFDPAAVAPEDCDDAIEYFLCDSHRGPDYLFSASAALLLRSLGYESRVRSGFYARSENYDRLADLTSIYKEDAHFWVEVLSTDGIVFNLAKEKKNGCWITVDPCPGYEVLYSPNSFLAMCGYAAIDAAAAVAEKPLLSTLAVIAACTLAWLRIPLLDRIVTAWWAVASRMRGPRGQVLETVRLLERRAWLRKQPRSPGTTIGRWSLCDRAGTFPIFDDFRRLASWAIYGEGVPSLATAEEVRSSCREVARVAMRPGNSHQPNSSR